MLIGSLLVPGILAADTHASLQSLNSKDLEAICSAWVATETTLRLATEIRAVADDGIRAARAMLTQCEAKPICQNSSEREFLEAGLKDAYNQHDRATALLTQMRERIAALQQRISRLPDGAVPQGQTASTIFCPTYPAGSSP